MSSADSVEDREDALGPADAFALVGDETRLAILEGLWRVETPARFSDLRRAVGSPDSAGFNYHLERLTGQFVRKTDAGYELRTAGERVVQAVVAGSFTEHPRRELDLADPCTQCGETLSAHYADERLTIACPACGHGHGEYPFPPGGLNDRTDAEVLAAFDQRVRHLHCLADDGVCPACGGRTETSVERGGECCLGGSLRAIHTCQQCAHERCAAVGLGLLDYSAVVSFCADHGVSLTDTPYWRLEWCVDDGPVTVLAEDPWRLQVDVEVDDATLAVTLDGDLDVLDARRR